MARVAVGQLLLGRAIELSYVQVVRSLAEFWSHVMSAGRIEAVRGPTAVRVDHVVSPPHRVERVGNGLGVGVLDSGRLARRIIGRRVAAAGVGCHNPPVCGVVAKRVAQAVGSCSDQSAGLVVDERDAVPAGVLLESLTTGVVVPERGAVQESVDIDVFRPAAS